MEIISPEPKSTTVADAIKIKYIESENNLPERSDDFVILVRVHGAGDRNDYYGIPRILVTHCLLNTDKENLAIDACGDKDFLIEKCRNRVNEIDLSRNKLTDWKEIFATLDTISPGLTFVNLSYNDLSSKCFENIKPELKLPCLKSLILVGTNISWTSLWSFLLAAKSSLEELNLSKNHFQIVEVPNPILPFDRVTSLMLNGNPFKSWDEVAKVGLVFPNLEQLGLTECEISAISENSGDNFHHLLTLLLSSNPLQEMDDISNLRNFVKLTEVKVLGTQVLPKFTDFDRRQFIIALLPNITKVNGGACITENERESSERSFIRFFDKNPNLKRPKRYNELKSIYGDLLPLVEIDMKPPKKLKLKFTMDEIEIEKTVSVYLTLGELKVFLEPLFGIQPKNQRLFYIDSEVKEIFGREEMKFPNKQLYSYSLKSGDEIQIDFKN